MTISEKRVKAIKELTERANGRATEADARKAMNSFYRLAGLDERLLYLQNDERTCNKSYTHELKEKAERWVERLNEYLKPFDACIVYFGYLPTICKTDSTQDLYLTYYYN